MSSAQTRVGILIFTILSCTVIWQWHQASNSPDGKLNNQTTAPLQNLPEEESAPRMQEIVPAPATSDPALSSVPVMAGAESLPQTEQQSLWTAFSEAVRRIRPLTDHQKTMPDNADALYLASVSRQAYLARFLPDGVRLLPGREDREWKAVLSLDDAGHVLDIRQQGSRIEYVRDGLIEWYDNQPDGLEQGFVIDRRSEALTDPASGELRLSLLLDGLRVESGAEGGLEFINEQGDPVLAYSKLQVWDANGNELSAAMEPTTHGLDIRIADAGAVYPVTVDPMITSLETRLGPDVDGTAGNDAFGYSVCLDGDTALVGSYIGNGAYVFVRQEGVWSEQAILTGVTGEALCLEGDTALVRSIITNNTPAAYVFNRIGTNWHQDAELTVPGATRIGFATSISLSGNTALIGDYRRTVKGIITGGAYVFVRDGTDWNLQADLTAPDAEQYDEFGGAVSLSGDTALIGSSRDDDAGTNSGSVYVFVRNGTNWNLQVNLVEPDGEAFHQFGHSVSLSGDLALIGSVSSSAYVYSRSGTNWSEQARLQGSGNGASPVSLSDDAAAISSWSVCVFARNGTNWTETAQLSPVEGTHDEWFGASLSLSDDTVLVGSFYYDFDWSRGSGSAYVFTSDGTNWNEEAKLSDRNNAELDHFGYSIALSGDTALVGSPYDNDNGYFSGSAYVFFRDGNFWIEQAKLLASDGAVRDYFGRSLSLSGDTVLIGSYEDDDGADYSGSAYVFVRDGTNWNEQTKLSEPGGAQWASRFGYLVDLSGETALIGNTSGSVYAFVRSGTVWNHQASLPVSVTYAGEYSMSLSGDTAFLGFPLRAPSEEIQSGRALVFERNGTNWSMQADLAAPDYHEDDQFGCSVNVSGDSALVGAVGDDDHGYYSGSAYVFVRDGTNWSLQAKLNASDGAAVDYFGYSVSLSGQRALIGAPYDDDLGQSSGSAYVFVRNGTNWTEQAKLTAPDVVETDKFGSQVSLSVDSALIGASDKYGFDTMGESIWGQGAAYIFRLKEIPTDTDGDGGSDAFETMYGFNSDDPTDFATKDADGDGMIDLFEIFHGTDKDSSASREGMTTDGEQSTGQVYVARYRRSTGDHGLVAYARWSDDLQTWHGSGGSSKGVRVEFTEQVVESDEDVEVVELRAHVVYGSVDHLFLRLDLTPTW